MLGFRSWRCPIKYSRALKLGAGLLVTIVCLAAALWDIPLADVKDSFARANYLTLPLMLLGLFLFFWLKAVRWRLLLEPVRSFETREVAPAMMIGFMGNNLVPAHLGEFMRAYVLGREFGVSKTAVLSSVVLERVFDVIAILLLLAVSLVFVKELPPEYTSYSLIIAAAAFAGLLVLGAYVVWTDLFVRIAERFLRYLPESIGSKLAEILEAGAAGLHSLRSPRLVIGITVTSVAQWAINGLTAYCAVLSFGQSLPLLASFFVIFIIAIGVTVPSTPGFFGVVQYCFWLGVRPFGVDQADAFAASVYYHLSQYIPVTLVGLYFLSRSGLKLTQVEQAAEQTAEDLEQAETLEREQMKAES